MSQILTEAALTVVIDAWRVAELRKVWDQPVRHVFVHPEVCLPTFFSLVESRKKNNIIV